MNTTNQPLEPSHSKSYVSLVFSVILAVLIVTENVLVIAAYRTVSRLQTRTNIFIVSLAVSDLLVGAVSVPIWTYLTFVNYLNVPPGLFDLFLCLDIFNALVSIFHLTAISFERYFAISRPFDYGAMSFGVHKYLIIALWLIAAIMAALSQVNRLITLKAVYTVVVFIVGFMLPAVLMIILYASIFRTARLLIHKTPSIQTANTIGNREREQRKVTLTVSIITGLFLLAWSPFFIVSILAQFCGNCLPNGEGITLLVVFVKWMHYSNSAVNPLVYVLRNGQMRRSVVNLIGIHKNDQRHRQSSPNQPAFI